MFRRDNKVAIFTGGTGGIGYQVARGLAEAGANIDLWYNGSSQAESLAMSLEKDFGIKSKAFKCSVQSFDEVQAATNAVVHDFGRLDFMIANAGIPSKAGGLDDKLEDWRKVGDIDFNGAYYCARTAGVIHLGKSLAVEWADFARVNCVSPGYVDTPISGDCPFEMWYSLTPLKRDADPRELKAIYLYLASDASTYTTGSDIQVDGGYTCR
ncbi:hypothetical protein PoHVEF18_008764 [Penicillium ochrochloron]